MAVLSASQQQSYLNLINQAPISSGTRLHLANVIEHSNSIDRINELCVKATKIDIAVFQEITNPGPDPKDIKIVSLTEEVERYKEALQTTETLEKDKNDSDDRATTAEERVLELEAQLEKIQEFYEELLVAKDNELENTVRYVGHHEDHHVDQGI
jgi:hypothetical protein